MYTLERRNDSRNALEAWPVSQRRHFNLKDRSSKMNDYRLPVAQGKRERDRQRKRINTCLNMSSEKVRSVCSNLPIGLFLSGVIHCDDK